MKFLPFLLDKIYALIIGLCSLVIILLIFMAFRVDISIILSVSIVLLVSYLLLFFISYFRKTKFYSDLTSNSKMLDKAYLVLETIGEPTFYEGKIIYDVLYEINKSMLENVNEEKRQNREFKEYVLMWIHEVKIPLSSILLTISNHKGKRENQIKRDLKRLEDYVNQVLYYVRQESAEVDYLINEVDLASVIKEVGLKNMNVLLEENILYDVQNIHEKVFTDSKWLEFILGQIINNAIKYRRNIKKSYIKIYTIRKKDNITLVIEDNGIGIPASDLKQVFNKSFTGENGRIRGKSTGMGLYIAYSLCEKLGHKLSIESEVNKFTRVSVTFYCNDYYEAIK